MRMSVYYARWILLSALTGTAAGMASSVFLYALHWVTSLRNQNGWILWLLPLCGLAIGVIYHHYALDSERGTDLVLDEVDNPDGKLPLKMAPLILLTTLMTHLFGGSAGREGTAVQMGAVFADQWRRYFSLTALEKRILLVAGMGAGFGSAIGAPWAGMIFGIEVVRKKDLSWRALIPSLVASWVACGVTWVLFAPHTSYPGINVPPFSFVVLGGAAIAGIVFGLFSRMYIAIAERLKKEFASLRYPPLRPLVGGVALLLLYSWEGSYEYVGLGLDQIQSAMITPSTLMAPIQKMIFTAITLSSGFKGGEFIPLVFMGTTLGSVVGYFFPSYFSLAAGLGFASVFAAASRTPLACSIMAIELFGIEIAPFVVVSCFVASFFNGPKRIYRSH